MNNFDQDSIKHVRIFHGAFTRRLFFAGLLFGLVVAIRVQLEPAIFVAAFHICWNA